MKFLKACDLVVAEVTNPSLGVGYEIGRAIENDKKVICLYRDIENKKISAMILGSKDILSFKYQDLESLKKILSINIKKGEVHALMGQNGSGKSTLSNILAGKEEYEISSDEMKFDGENLSDLNVEERSRNGLFLAFQYPVEIPGVNITPFLRTALNSKLKNEGIKKEISKILKISFKKD